MRIKLPRSTLCIRETEIQSPPISTRIVSPTSPSAQEKQSQRWRDDKYTGRLLHPQAGIGSSSPPHSPSAFPSPKALTPIRTRAIPLVDMMDYADCAQVLLVAELDPRRASRGPKRAELPSASLLSRGARPSGRTRGRLVSEGWSWSRIFSLTGPLRPWSDHTPFKVQNRDYRISCDRR